MELTKNKKKYEMVAGHIFGNAGTSFGAVAAGEMLRLGNYLGVLMRNLWRRRL